MGKYLSRSEILSADDIKTREVPCPEWGGVVLVRGMSAAERDSVELSVSGKGGPNLQNIRAKIAARCIVDEAGQRIFSDEEIEALGKKAAAPIDRVFTAAVALSKLAPEDARALSKN
jgi:hypothetical protein